MAMIGRVVIVSDDAVESGGAAGIALASARLLSARGIPVTILNGSSDPDDIGRKLGVGVISLKSPHLMEGGRGPAAIRGIYNGAGFRFVRDWIAANDTPDTIYHLHNWHKVLSASVFSALDRVADRLFISAHDYFLVCPNGGQFHYPKGSVCELRPMSPACVLSNCDRRHYGHKLWRVARQGVRERLLDLGRTPATVLAVHEGMLPYLTRGGVAPGSVRVLRNPVVPWRDRRVVAERNRDVFFVGRLEKDKGVDVVAEAARKAGATLRVIGDGPLRDQLRREHPEAELLGWRPRAEIAGLIASARFLVVPTRWRETFGLVTLEALTSGVPVLVSKFALVAQELVGLGCAEFCDPYDPEALAGSIARLAADDERIRVMSERGYAHAPDLAPTPQAWCDRLIHLYRAKLAQAGPRNSGVQCRFVPA